MFVRPFFAGGGPGVSCAVVGTAVAEGSAAVAAAVGAGAIGLGVTGWPDNRRFLELTDVFGVLCVCRLLNLSGVGWPGADMVETGAEAPASVCCGCC